MKFRLSSEFGAMEEVRKGEPHNGIDVSMPIGTEIHSIVNGVVERITDYGSENIGTGLIVRLESGTRAIYGHLSEVNVEVGDKIETGDLIALSGNTGNSTGPHLHFALLKDGEYINTNSLSDEIIESAGKASEGVPWWDIQGKTEAAVNDAMNGIQERAKEQTAEWLEGAAEALLEFFIGGIYSIALIGGGLLIILHVAGWKQGGKWASILFVINAFIVFITGGVSR
jgi:murein DD-endopeptidase MepM/ murein hydrolase activator NlpD